jgi:hypothetical protein
VDPRPNDAQHLDKSGPILLMEWIDFTEHVDQQMKSIGAVTNIRE